MCHPLGSHFSYIYENFYSWDGKDYTRREELRSTGETVQTEYDVDLRKSKVVNFRGETLIMPIPIFHLNFFNGILVLKVIDLFGFRIHAPEALSPYHLITPNSLERSIARPSTHCEIPFLYTSPDPYPYQLIPYHLITPTNLSSPY